ncbi:MAG: efflux RND transporter periplasmic adaptor subunit [Verrucomicrobia bacterium]|nr:efflux RND transporter periplasmic adaptor subunit [Verrucomicrobiota bacterium]
MNKFRDTHELVDTSASRPTVTWAGNLVRGLIPLALLAIGLAGYLVLSRKPPEAPAVKGAPKPLRTRVLPMNKGNFPIEITTQGVVRSHTEVSLTSQVNGRIVSVSSAFEDGAFFQVGEILLELDPIDFELAVVSAKAQLARAETILSQEQTRARQARLNWEDLGYEEEPNELVLRLPQLREAEIGVDSAKSQVESAMRNLERSKVRAPFSGRVLRRMVGVGQTIAGSTPLGTIFATDYAEVRLPLASKDLKFLTLPEKSDDPPLAVEFMDALDSTSPHRWKGWITRTEGALDGSTLELFVIARIDDPFGLHSDAAPLRMGQPVTARIEGKPVENVFKVPREAVFELNKIIVVDPETMKLSNRQITVIFGTESELYISDPGGGSWLFTGHHPACLCAGRFLH